MKGKEYLENDTDKKLTKLKEAKRIGPTYKSGACLKSEKRMCIKFKEEKRENIFKLLWKKPIGISVKFLFVHTLTTSK